MIKYLALWDDYLEVRPIGIFTEIEAAAEAIGKYVRKGNPEGRSSIWEIKENSFLDLTKIDELEFNGGIPSDDEGPLDVEGQFEQIRQEVIEVPEVYFSGLFDPEDPSSPDEE